MLHQDILDTPVIFIFVNTPSQSSSPCLQSRPGLWVQKWLSHGYVSVCVSLGPIVLRMTSKCCKNVTTHTHTTPTTASYSQYKVHFSPPLCPFRQYRDTMAAGTMVYRAVVDNYCPVQRYSMFSSWIMDIGVWTGPGGHTNTATTPLFRCKPMYPECLF